MAIRAKSCSILGRFCFRIGSVIALAGARDLLAIGTKSGSFSKVFWTLGGGALTDGEMHVKSDRIDRLLAVAA